MLHISSMQLGYGQQHIKDLYLGDIKLIAPKLANKDDFVPQLLVTYPFSPDSENFDGHVFLDNGGSVADLKIPERTDCFWVLPIVKEMYGKRSKIEKLFDLNLNSGTAIRYHVNINVKTESEISEQFGKNSSILEKMQKQNAKLYAVLKEENIDFGIPFSESDKAIDILPDGNWLQTYPHPRQIVSHLNL